MRLYISALMTDLSEKIRDHSRDRPQHIFQKHVLRKTSQSLIASIYIWSLSVLPESISLGIKTCPELHSSW